MDRFDDLLEDRNELRDSAIKRILRPLASLVHRMRADPEESKHPWPGALNVSEAKEDYDRISAGLARMEINRRFGWPLNSNIPSDLLEKISKP